MYILIQIKHAFNDTYTAQILLCISSVSKKWKGILYLAYIEKYQSKRNVVFRHYSSLFSKKFQPKYFSENLGFKMKHHFLQTLKNLPLNRYVKKVSHFESTCTVLIPIRNGSCFSAISKTELDMPINLFCFD